MRSDLLVGQSAVRNAAVAAATRPTATCHLRVPIFLWSFVILCSCSRFDGSHLFPAPFDNVTSCSKSRSYDRVLYFAARTLLTGAARAVGRSARWIDVLRLRWWRLTIDVVVQRSHIR